MKIRAAFCALSFAVGLAFTASAAPTDDIADVIVQAVNKPTITAESLPEDFARLTKFVRHDANGMILFSDGGPTDGYVHHAQARFDNRTPHQPGAGTSPFTVAFELANEGAFTFEGFSAALAARMGTPTSSSNQTGATFRTWQLKQPAGRSLTVATAQASDGPDQITIVQLSQK